MGQMSTDAPSDHHIASKDGVKSDDILLHRNIVVRMRGNSILVVLTSADKIPKNGKTIGWYLPELAHPFEVLNRSTEMVFASPKGGISPLDPASVEAFKDYPVCKDFFENQESVWHNTAKLSDFAGRASEFDAVFYPGGHGPMVDLVDNQDSKNLLRELHDQVKVISAVFHGPVALVNALTAKARVKELEAQLQAANIEPQRENLTPTQESFFLDLFWDSWHCCYQILDEAEFRAHYKSLWNDLTGTSRRASAIVDVLSLKLRSTSATQQSWVSSSTNDARGSWHIQFWSAVYLSNASYQNMAQDMLGVALRTAHAFGLHVEPVADLPSKEREARKRMWWTLCVFETRFCIRLGRPWATRMNQAKCSLPTENQELRPDGLTWLSYTIQRAQLMQVFRIISDKLYIECEPVETDYSRNSPSGRRDHPLEIFAEVLEAGIHDMQAWVDVLPPALKTERRENGKPFSADLADIGREPFSPVCLRRKRLMLEL
ncbi:hypothetical protein FZEAL_9786 [Fusarium zealandicum]|uniref:Xylanolytic transcriptional activator regulatory domain-containing protein n=1 Tax=Fusarium zealandicum TaxID=1053134 RepID=A0A8H4U8S5_9HYPO|nr:hypothetical protein FZEAL_9786 [Fusarium zealandicum]